MKRLLLIMAAMYLFIAGCATVPPVIHEVRSTETFDVKSGEVVDSVKDFFNKEKIPVNKRIDDSGLVDTEEIKVPYEGFQYLSDYCDCGAPGGLYVYHEILGKFNTIIKETDNSKTSINIGASYRASLWWNDTFVGWVECQSKGYIESKLIEYVNAAIKKKMK